MIAILKLRRVLLLLTLFTLALGCDDGGGSDPVDKDSDVEADMDVEQDEDIEQPPADVGLDPDVLQPDVGPDTDATPTCECEAPEHCDEAGECVNTCEADEDCGGAPWICEEGTCVAGCEDDTGCQETPETPACVEGRCYACASDDHCRTPAQIAAEHGPTCDAEARTCVEPETCEVHGECFPGRTCEGTCTDGFDCRVDGFDCPGALTCLEDSGECAPAAGDCGSDDECGLYEICGNRGCEICDRDNDCPGDQICAGGRCAEGPGCSDDEDCWGGRECNGGACEPPSCQEDEMGGNHSVADAAPLAERVYRGLSSCAPDFFAVDVPEDSTGVVIVRQNDRGFDLALNSYSEEGTLLTQVDTSNLVETIILGPYPSERTVIVEVTQAAFAGGTYDIELRFPQAGECVDDGAEQGAGDDSAATGTFVRARGDLTFGEPVVQRMCAGDDDYVCFYLGREELTVRAEIVLGDPVLQATLYDEDGELVEGAEGRWVRNGETSHLRYSNRSSGDFCLRLFAEEGAGTYRLDITALNTNAIEACEAGTFVDQFPYSSGGMTLEGSSAMQATCAASDGADAVYQFSTDQAHLLVARVTGSPTGSLGDPVLSVRSDCPQPASELACAATYFEPDHALFPILNPVELRVALEEPSDYALLVDSNEPIGDRPQYTVEMELLPLPAAPDNDTCDEAEALDLDPNGLTEITLNLARAEDDVAGCFGEGAPDAVYMVDLPEAARVRVLADADFAVGAYLTPACDGVSPVACGYGFEQEVPAGPHYLVIDGASDNSRGRVTVRVEVESADVVPANDGCAGAEALAAAGEWLAGSTRGANDDYSLPAGNGCTEYNTDSADVAYTLSATAGERVYVEAMPERGWDLSLYAVTSCNSLDPCVEGSDGALTETLVFNMPQAEVNVIVDGSNGEHGDFQIRWGVVECESNDDCGDGAACDHFACVD